MLDFFKTKYRDTVGAGLAIANAGGQWRIQNK